MIHIPEVEMAFSNACTARCYICCPTHGRHKPALMSQEVFDNALWHLQGIKFDILQTGGDGDSFLNPIYLDSLRLLRTTFSAVKIVLYSNFALLDPEVADLLTGERLIDELYTRIDTLDPYIFKLCTGLDQETVFLHIDYFIEINLSIRFQINYSNIKNYRRKCRGILNKDPVFWRPEFESIAENEYSDIIARFGKSGKKVNFSDIKQSLWAERTDPAIKIEPSLQCGRTYCFDSVCYIWTNGDVGICGYDDGQDTLVYGNILCRSIEDLWNSQERQQVIEKVKRREIKNYPCINPKACLFY